MKRVLCSLILFFVLPSWSMAFDVNRGGVSGGGGNVISPRSPTSSIDYESAEHVVYHSHKTAIEYVARKREAFLTKQMTPEQQIAFAPIFNSEKNIESVMAAVPMYVRDHSTCRDAEQKPVDGSIVNPVPDSICISAFTIANKTDATDIPPQSTALILHEYSELVGLTEDQAVTLQTIVLEELRGL